MADELNVPTHRWYEPRNNIALPPNAVSPKYILANGVAMIDAWINSQPWGMPLYLFAANEPGWMYDNSDMSTLFQDSAGTTPVTAVGQPVGLQLDKSKGLVLGPELVTNGDFSAGSTGWNLIGTGWSIGSGVLSGSAVPANDYGPHQISTSVVAGVTYKATYTITVAAGGVAARVGNTQSSTYTSSGTYTQYFVATSTGVTVFQPRAGGSGFTGTIDNISVKELAGTHRTQSTAASRPTFARLPVTGRRNLLTYTEQFDNAAWTAGAVNLASFSAGRITPNTTLGQHRLDRSTTIQAAAHTFSLEIKPDGYEFIWLRLGLAGAVFNATTGVATNVSAGVTASSSPASDGYFRVSISVVTSANDVARINASSTTTSADFAGDGTSGVLIRKAQLELGSTATNYQKVVSLYDITEAGVQTAYGLYYDGVDDFLVTPTITPGTDKVQVFAGVRKLSDAARAIVVELGGGVFNSFRIEAPNVAGSAQYVFTSQGTSSANPVYTNASVAAPNTSTITGLGDISGDRATLRINGTQVAQVTTDQGTGGYNANPVYFGRRGGTTLPFNGYTFREVGRFGPNLDTATIANVEGWINQATGAY